MRSAILEAKRLPIGSFLGQLKSFSVTDLGGKILESISLKEVDEIYMGCVLAAGTGQAPARQAAALGGFANSIPATLINKVCGSGMKAVMNAHDQICLGGASFVIGGGMESMSNAPYLLPKIRCGYRFGNREIIDHITKDGLENAYPPYLSMGLLVENMALKFGISREGQEEFVLGSYENAHKTSFEDEIVPLLYEGQAICQDEHLSKVKPEKFSRLQPAFAKDGTITAATSSPLSDGAAALLLGREDCSNALGYIVGHATHAQAPEDFGLGPIGAIARLCLKLGWAIQEIDLFEINEAFAVVPLVVMQELSIPRSKINVRGGACVLGHPLGASGARIIGTLLHALRRRGGGRGIATLCIGGGEATAVAIEC